MEVIEKIKLIRFLRRHRFKDVFTPREDDNMLALNWCAQHNALEHAKRILHFFPAAINIADDSMNTALHIAASYGNMQMVTYFASIAPYLVTAENNSGLLPLHFAIINNPTQKITDFLIEQAPETMIAKTNRGLAALHFAVLRDKESVCKKIIFSYPDQIYAKDDNGFTPLAKTDHPKSRSAKLILQKDLLGTFMDLPEQIFDENRRQTLDNIISVVEDVLKEKFPDREHITKKEKDIRNKIAQKCVFERIMLDSKKPPQEENEEK